MLRELKTKNIKTIIVKGEVLTAANVTTVVFWDVTRVVWCVQTFLRDLLLPFSGYMNRDIKFLRSVGTYLLDCTASHPRRS
jgi:hypothetical protein